MHRTTICTTLLICYVICAPSASAKQAPPSALVLESFEASKLPVSIKPINAEVAIVSDVGVTHGSKALEIQFTTDTGQSGIQVLAKEPWDTSDLGDCRFEFDVYNRGPTSVHLRCEVVSSKGVKVRRAVAVEAEKEQSCYYELRGGGVGEDRGLRDDPACLPVSGLKMITSSSKYPVDYRRVKQINLYVSAAATADTVVIDNLRIVSNPPLVSGCMEGLVDAFGQNAKHHFAWKVQSEEDLSDRATEELAQLRASGPMPDRSRFGGWLNGPQLEATGYFRPEKIGERWTLVDPDGHLYFATGIANIRMANTSTYTGVDFHDPSVKYKDPEDLTPEDSIDIRPTSAEARKTRFIAYPERHAMFTWLPDYRDPLAQYYGYRRESHIGPIEHGEVFSFYLANLHRRYGGPTREEVLQTWREVTLDRMLDWGFTSLGNWADASFFQNEKVPYFANGWIIGDFKTVSSGKDYWGPMPDVFDPEFERRAQLTVEAVAAEVQGSPWCVGVFIDNEKAWGSMGSPESQFGIVINTLGRDAAEVPLKAKWVEMLKDKYATIEELNEAWGCSIESWDSFAEHFAEQDEYSDAEMLADFSDLLQAYTNKYFQTVHDALEKVMPNHMYMGCRMTTWGMTQETWRAARQYTDVMSYNYYREQLGERDWGFLTEVDRPSIIGEWHNGSTDSGLFNPGLIQAVDQHDRGKMYQIYMNSVVANPNFVGAHWFQYIDSPLTGRAHDGENYNVGFVTVADTPYQPLVDAAREFNSTLYDKAYGDIDR